MKFPRSPLARFSAQAIGSALIFSAALLAGAYLTRPVSATVQLIVPDRMFSTPAEAASFAAMATSTGYLAKLTAPQASLLTPRILSEQCTVNVAQGQPTITISALAKDSASAYATVEALAKHVVDCGNEWISRRSGEIDDQLTAVQKQLRDLRHEFSDFNEALLSADLRSLKESLIKDASERTAKVTSLKVEFDSVIAQEKKTVASLIADRPALRAVQQELDQALSRYTEEHPKVKELRASISALQKDSANNLASLGSSQTNAQLVEVNSRLATLRDELKKAEAAALKSRRALQKFATNEIEFARFQIEYEALGAKRDQLVQSRVLVGSKSAEKWQSSEHVKLAGITSVPRLQKYGWSGAAFGLCLGVGAAGISQRRRKVIRTTTALSDATGLPVLATLPDLSTMDSSAREYWGIETMKTLRNTAGISRNGSLVCGFISANSGDGCCTCIDLLAQAGVRCGNRVLVISQPGAERLERLAAPVGDAAQLEVQSDIPFTLQPATAPESNRIARYTVASAGEAWFQKDWEHALTDWQTEDSALVLVELPSASKADALLLSSAVPHVVWVSAANVTEAQETKNRITSLKKTGCNLIGAVLNYAAARMVLGFWLAGFIGSSAVAQEQKAVTPVNVASRAPALAPWQQRLTVGAGDVFDISIYGQADSMRPAVAVGPDGRFTYLQARDVEAVGLTIDELRTKLEGVLGKFYLSPRVIVVPVAFHSKKYFVLGNVVQPGAFTLDKPTTVVQAIAKARGFVSGGQQRSSFNLADLTRAFLVRRGENGEFTREPVDFEKLFLHGELQENRLLAPDDYLYFPPLGLEEVYVLGEVAGTGVVPYTKDLTVLGAIAARGGFKRGAFREKILVIRGSLNQPEAFAFGTNGVQQLRAALDVVTPETTIINTAEALRANIPDFALRPRDIVYVSRKPWAKAEELLEAASSDFVRAMVVSWTGVHVGTLSR